MSMVTFKVYGEAQQKGSARGFVVKSKKTGKLRSVITTDNPGTKGWEHDIRAAAASHVPPVLWTGPVLLVVSFAMKRTKTMKAKWLPFLKAPDTDKLLRCVGDALTGVIYEDDAQVVLPVALKRYADPGEAPHALIRVRQIPSDELLKLRDYFDGAINEPASAIAGRLF